MPMHEIVLYLNKMNNVLINEDINLHNVRYLLQIEVQETKQIFSFVLIWKINGITLYTIDRWCENKFCNIHVLWLSAKACKRILSKPGKSIWWQSVVCTTYSQSNVYIRLNKCKNKLVLLFRLYLRQSLYIRMQEYFQDEHQSRFLRHFYKKKSLKNFKTKILRLHLYEFADVVSTVILSSLKTSRQTSSL
jgi:hypothetical protein